MPVDEGFLPLAVHPQAVEVMPVARKGSAMVEAQTGRVVRAVDGFTST